MPLGEGSFKCLTYKLKDENGQERREKKKTVKKSKAGRKENKVIKRPNIDENVILVVYDSPNYPKI